MLARPLILLGVVWLLGAVLHHLFGAPPGGDRPSWGDAFFVSYNLLFLEHFAELPAHPVGRAVQYVQPIFGVFLLAEGVFALGLTMFDKSRNQEKWMQILATSTRDHVVLCGLGNVGFRVLESLHGMGERVFIVEIDPDAPLLERAREMGAEVLIGDARSDHVLQSLNLAGARAVIVATDNDLANLEIAMDVHEHHKGVPVVMRLFDQRLARKVQSTLGITATFSTSKLAAPLLATAALDPSAVGHHQVGETDLVVLELRVGPGSAFDGASIATLRDEHGVVVVAIESDGWVTDAATTTTLAGGQRMRVMVPGARVKEMHRLNGER